MENLAPPLILLLCVRQCLEKGQPIGAGIHSFLSTQRQSEFKKIILNWIQAREKGGFNQIESMLKSQSIYRRALIKLLERGFDGESIYLQLCQLEEEIIEASEDELANELARLPFLLLIPLLFFQFPAFLILLFGPLLQRF